MNIDRRNFPVGALIRGKVVSMTAEEACVQVEDGIVGWLMKLTQWRIADKFESQGKFPVRDSVPRADTPARTATIERVPAPMDDEDEWDREWQRHVLAAAIDRVARQVKPRHFQVFELYVRQQWPVLKVSTELRINPASVYLIAHRLTRQLKAEVAKLQKHLG